MTTQSLPSHTHHAAPAHEPPAALRATGSSLVLTVVIAIVAIAFALPAARSKPHDVPIGAAGPQAASGQVADMLEHNAPGAFEITYYPGEAALRDAIRNRDVYGGISLGPDGRTLLIATGGSPTVAQLLSQVGNGIAQHAGVAAAHRRPGPADRRRPAWRRAGGVRTADNAGRNAARHRAGARAPARGVDPVHGRSGVRWAGRLRPSPPCCDSCSARSTRTSGALPAASTLGALASGLSMLGLGSLFGRVGLAVGAAARAVAGQPAVGPDQCARASAQRMGCPGSVVAAGRQRHAAALDGILRRRRAPRWRSSC